MSVLVQETLREVEAPLVMVLEMLWAGVRFVRLPGVLVAYPDDFLEDGGMEDGVISK